jgi:hypothetical protein
MPILKGDYKGETYLIRLNDGVADFIYLFKNYHNYIEKIKSATPSARFVKNIKEISIDEAKRINARAKILVKGNYRINVVDWDYDSYY